jgi:integrase
MKNHRNPSHLRVPVRVFTPPLSCEMRVQDMLTNSEIKSLRHSGKKGADKHLDRDQLYLYVLPTGTKSWRLRYRIKGKEDTLVIGQYPAFSLKDAREAAQEARTLIAKGVDPKEEKRRVASEEMLKQTHLFSVVADKWISMKDRELEESTMRKHKSRLAKYLLPALGSIAVADITAPMILKIGEEIQAKGSEHEAHRVVRLCKQILQYATISGLVQYNVAYGVTAGLSRPKTKHRTAPLKDEDIRAVLQRIEKHIGSPQVSICLKLVPHLFMSPIDITAGRWKDIDLENGIWSFKRRKSGVPTIAPLSDYVKSQLRQIRAIYPNSEWVFPSPNNISNPISSGSLNAALRRCGVAKNEATIHGFRATARTLLVEKFGYRQDIVEQQISHTVKDPNGRAYNRTMFLTERREMLETWSTYLRELMSPNRLTSVA